MHLVELPPPIATPTRSRADCSRRFETVRRAARRSARVATQTRSGHGTQSQRGSDPAFALGMKRILAICLLTVTGVVGCTSPENEGGTPLPGTQSGAPLFDDAVDPSDDPEEISEE